MVQEDISTTSIAVGELVFTANVCGPTNGRPVLFLHGFPQTSWSWHNQLLALGAAGFHAVAIDQRGYSRGARPIDVFAYSMANLIGDVINVADTLGWSTFDLVGHDWGGAVAWQTAGRHRDRIRSLTVLSTPHPQAFGDALVDVGGEQATKSGYIEFFRSAEAEGVFLAADDDGPGSGLRGLFAATGLSIEASRPYVDVLTEPGALTAALNWYRSSSLIDIEGLGPISMPTMYIWSTDDPALGRVAAEATARYIQGPYRFEVLEGINHWVAELAPQRCNELLLEHLTNN